MPAFRPRPPWFPRIAATLATALLATPLAAALGSAVLWLAVRQETTDASLLLLAAFVFYGTLIGSLIAAPVTLAALPAAALLLHARLRLLRWLLPLLGLLLGAWRMHESIAMALEQAPVAGLFDPARAMALAGMAGGLVAGLLFAWLPPLLSPRGFPLPPGE